MNEKPVGERLIQEQFGEIGRRIKEIDDRLTVITHLYEKDGSVSADDFRWIIKQARRP